VNDRAVIVVAHAESGETVVVVRAIGATEEDGHRKYRLLLGVPIVLVRGLLPWPAGVPSVFPVVTVEVILEIKAALEGMF